MRSFQFHIDRPRRNAIDVEFLAWFEAQLAAANGAPMLLSGTTQAFCAGLDLRFLLTLEGRELEHFLRRVDRLFRSLYEYPGPVVALVEGHAIAGGGVLLACCDQRVCTAREGVRLGLTEVALGACFPPSTLRICRDRIPRRFQEEVLLGAGLYSPREALQVGLVDRVEVDAYSTAHAILAQLAAHPPEVYAHTKRALRAGVAVVSPQDEQRFVEQELPRWSSPDLRDRVRAMLGIE
jgi:enoyl-CoA hydratase